MKKLEIKIDGETDGDLMLAIEEVKAKVEQGYLSGFDGNDSGNYSFNVMEIEK